MMLLDRFDGILDEKTARFYLAEIALALHDLHNMGYVHRSGRDTMHWSEFRHNTCTVQTLYGQQKQSRMPAAAAHTDSEKYSYHAILAFHFVVPRPFIDASSSRTSFHR